VAEPFVLVDREGDILWLTLNRPQQLNAVHLQMRDELWAMLTMLRDDPTVRVAVLRGAGRAFSAGADITEFGSAPSFIDAREARLNRDLWGLMSRLPMPLIAAIHGFAFGAGLEMSLYCDLRIAADDARFALPEVTLGYIPSAGGTQTVSRHINRSDALRLATTGDPIDAAEAYEIGLVHAIVPPDRLDAEAREWAERLAARDPRAMRLTKRAVVEGLDRSLADGLTLERRLAAAARSVAS
jgi:enoyl-CoA hydratase/carnithine racemase